MNKKIIWIDTETGGTNDKSDALVQLSAIIEMGGEVVDTIDLKMKPVMMVSREEWDGGDVVNTLPKRITKEALQVQGRTMSDIEAFEDPRVCYNRFYKFLQREPKSKTSRFIVGGYNTDFDLRFLFQWFQDISGGPYAFWDYLQFSPIDVLPTLRAMRHWGVIDVVDTKLETVCKYFGIELEAHNSMSDITATRLLTHKIYGELFSNWKKV